METGASWVRMVVNLEAGSHCPNGRKSWDGEGLKGGAGIS